ncbi:hypothetical protein D3C75_1149620 [compost metagenome]
MLFELAGQAAFLDAEQLRCSSKRQLTAIVSLHIFSDRFRKSASPGLTCQRDFFHHQQSQFMQLPL